MEQPRALTHDEKKAAEAAFNGRPFHDSWSKSARIVYDGILSARGEGQEAGGPVGEHPVAAEPAVHPVMEKLEETSTWYHGPQQVLPPSLGPAQQIALRGEAIEAGLLIDVTKMAKGVGLNMAVGITKSLWDRNIHESEDASKNEHPNRVRDMLLAVRLRLASLESPTPWVEVPVLYPSESEDGPQFFPIYALFHKDPVDAECLTLLHPKELSSIRPSPASTTDDECA